MRIAALCVVALLTSSSLGASELALVPPKQNGLRLRHLNRTELTATYVGSVEIAGTLIGEWLETQGDEDPTPTMSYIVILDEEARANLPHFENYSLTSIAPSNGPNALAMAAGRKMFREFREHKISRIEVKGHFTVSKLELGVDCDSPWARAHIDRVGAHQPPKVMLTKNLNGCSVSVSSVASN